jgi:hypothetical protein
MQLPSSIEGFNEMDVREEIITPLLHHLGYQPRSAANIIREQSLRYPRKVLGRKNPLTDPPLRGRADYILEVDQLVRWTVEAKSPTAAISTDDVEQAYSYACHPEIRAVYFAIVNGSEMRVYQANHGPDAEPILTVAYPEMAEHIQAIENLLRPDSIRRDHPKVAPDTGRPIGPGLRSLVRVVSGLVEFSECTPAVPLLAQMILYVTDGAIERDDEGSLIIYVKTHSPFRFANELNARLGLSRLELVSDDSVLSTTERSPTTFRQEIVVTLPEGETFPNLLGEGDLVLSKNLTCHSTTIASGVLERARFIGRFLQRYEYIDLPNVGDRLLIDASGRFEVVLA